MPRNLWAVVLLVATVACGGKRLAPPPALFPLATAWIRDLPQPLRPPLASDGERLLLAGGDGRLRALALQTGSIVWGIPSGLCTVSARKGFIVVRRADGSVSALNPADGSERWTAQTGLTGELPAEIADDQVLIAGEGLVALEATTGRVLWKAKAPPTTALPTRAGSHVIVGDAGGLSAFDAGTGKPAWRLETAGPSRAPVAVDDARHAGFVGAGRALLSIDVQKGSRRWRWRLGTEVVGSAALVEDRVLFASLEDVLYAHKRGNGNQVWRAGLPTRPISGPLLVGTAALVLCYGTRPEETLGLAFDARTGARLGDFQIAGEVQGEPLVVGEHLVVGMAGPRVAVYRMAGIVPSLTSPTADVEH